MCCQTGHDLDVDCRPCRPLAIGGLLPSGGRLDVFVDPYATCPPFPSRTRSAALQAIEELLTEADAE